MIARSDTRSERFASISRKQKLQRFKYIKIILYIVGKKENLRRVKDMNGKIEVIRGKENRIVEFFDSVCDAAFYAKSESGKIKNINIVFMVHVPNYIDEHSSYFFYMNGHFIGDNDYSFISEEDLHNQYFTFHRIEKRKPTESARK